MKIGILFLTLAVSTNAYHDQVSLFHDPEKVVRPDGDPVIIDNWSVGSMTRNGFQANTLNYSPVIVRQGNGYIRHITTDELNKLLNDPTFRIPGPRDDHVPPEVHYAERIGGPEHTGNLYGDHHGGYPHAQSFGEIPHEQSNGGLHEHIFGATGHPQQHFASPRPQHGGASPQLQHGAGGFPGGMHNGMPAGMPSGMSGGMPGGMAAEAPHAPQFTQDPRHISSGSRSNSELSVRSGGSQGSRGSRRSRGSIGSQSSRHDSGIPNLHQPGDANAAHGGIPNIPRGSPRGSPHVHFAGSGSLEQFAESPHSQMSGGSQVSYRSSSGRPKSRLGPGGIPAGMPDGGSHAHQFAEDPRHISSGSRSNSDVSYRSGESLGSQGSLGSRGSRRRNPAGSAQPPHFPPGNGEQPQFPGGYPYEGSDAGSQDGYESSGSARLHKSAEAPKTPIPSGEKKQKKNALTNLWKKLKISPAKKPST